MKKLVKKVLSLVLVASFCLSNIYINPAYRASAANVTEGNIAFEDGSPSATIIEGRDIGLLVTAPEDYVIVYEKNFSIYQGSTPVPTDVLKVVNNNGKYTLKAGTTSGSTSVAGDYQIKASFYSKNNKGDVYINEAVVYDATFSGSGKYITSDSSIVFKCVNDAYIPPVENPPVPPDTTGTITPEKVYAPVWAHDTAKPTTGLFARGQITGATSRPPKITSSGYEYTIDVQIKDTLSGITETIKLTFTTAEAIDNNDSVTFNFYVKSSSDIFLTVKSPKQVLEEIRDSVENPAFETDFIKVAPDNLISYLTKSFQLRTEYTTYGNAKVFLQWSWVADDPTGHDGKNATAIKIPPQTTSQWITTIPDPQDNNVKGRLIANLVYNNKDSRPPTSGDYPGPSDPKIQAVIESVVVIGNGILPTVTVKGTKLANNKTPSFTMDVNDRVAPDENPRQFDHEINLELNFGASSKEAQYVILSSTNPEVASISTVLSDGKTTPYTFGNQLANGAYLQGGNYTINNIITAKSRGNTLITAEYYDVLPGTDKKILLAKYSFNLMVEDTSPSRDATLKTLSAKFLKDGKYIELSLPFDPKTEMYYVDVPASVKEVYLEPIKNDAYAKKITEVIKMPDIHIPVANNGRSAAIPLNTESSTVVQIPVTAQDSTVTKTYVVQFKHLMPSNDATLSNLQVKDKSGSYVPITPKFDPAKKEYTISVPYATKQVEILPVTNNAGASFVVSPLTSNILDKIFKTGNVVDLNVGETTITVDVTAENEVATDVYKIVATRLQPKVDATLKSLEVKDQDGKKIDIKFNTKKLVYELDVPYATSAVLLTPTANDADVFSIVVNGTNIPSGTETNKLALTHSTVNTISIAVTAQDETSTLTYQLNINREPPSSDAMLKALTVKGMTLSPNFFTSTFSYKTEADDKTTEAVVTATPNYAGAKVTVNNMKVENGKAAPAILLTQRDMTITVVVTAEDGTTTSTYTIKIKKNLTPKSSNADLKSLTIPNSQMMPEFKPSITTYNVAVDQLTDFVELKPVPANSKATMVVKAGSKEIGDNNKNYSSAIKDGANKFTIEVTAEDGQAKKTYEITVNRNVKGMNGIYKPITADMIDFKKDDTTLYVDITKYTVVASDVFKELAKHPEKSIVFLSTDYSLTFKGSDLNVLVPFAPSYDLRMSFESPNEDEILSLINDDTNKPLFLHFTYHGALPGRATLNVHLGTPYKNKIMYLNYYNQPSKRIDYYGSMNSTSRGAVTLSISHFSDYLITPKMVKNSWDKSVEEAIFKVEKNNPNTGKLILV